jgi:hypothetical protein
MENAFGQLRPHFSNRTWLAPANRYAADTINRLKADMTNPTAVAGADLSQYVAASAPLHLLDGWTFLGRAVDASLRGDPDTARHLAYYAELRAAMALLASEGLGVFDKQHFVVESSMPPSMIRSSSGTHAIVWDLLKAWCVLPKAADLIGQIVAVGGVPLASWIGHFGIATGNSLQPVAADWLATWGLDLRQFHNDRGARNEASYRPSGLLQNNLVGSHLCVDTVADLWRVLEPAAMGQFEVIDSYLLRLCTETIFSSVTVSPNKSAARKRYRLEVDRMIANVNLGGNRELRAFLLRGRQRVDSEILRLARKSDPPSAPDHHLQVLSRAALLLRIAGGACALLLRAGGTSGSNLRFWWSHLGEMRGYWDRGSAPQNLTDLWADTEQALDQLDATQSRLGRRANLLKVRQETKNEAGILGECERIGLWGINV